MKKIKLENMKNKVKELKENEKVMTVVKISGKALSVVGLLAVGYAIGNKDKIEFGRLMRMDGMKEMYLNVVAEMENGNIIDVEEFKNFYIQNQKLAVEKLRPMFDGVATVYHCSDGTIIIKEK